MEDVERPWMINGHVKLRLHFYVMMSLTGLAFNMRSKRGLTSWHVHRGQRSNMALTRWAEWPLHSKFLGYVFSSKKKQHFSFPINNGGTADVMYIRHFQVHNERPSPKGKPFSMCNGTSNVVAEFKPTFCFTTGSGVQYSPFLQGIYNLAVEPAHDGLPFSKSSALSWRPTGKREQKW